MENEPAATVEPPPEVFTPPPIEQPKPPRRITKLSELQAMCEERFDIEIQITSNEPVLITGRRLTPAESTILDEIINSVLPPSIKGVKAEDDRFDFNNAGFIKAKKAAMVKARALGVYWAYPMYWGDGPLTTDTEAIVKFVQSKLTEAVLQVLWQQLQDGGVRKVSFINFSSANSQTN